MLVRGVPLSSTATEYAWATNEVYSLAQEVVDAAHELAQLSLEAGRYDDAIWAAERGLLADPLAEVLVRDLMEAAAATGNTARVHAAMSRLRRQVAEDADANDADDWIHPETVATFDRLRASTRAFK
jgi:two-component SAPR family response regulator